MSDLIRHLSVIPGLTRNLPSTVIPGSDPGSQSDEKKKSDGLENPDRRWLKACEF